jgi:hypothetical protein
VIKIKGNEFNISAIMSLMGSETSLAGTWGKLPWRITSDSGLQGRLTLELGDFSLPVESAPEWSGHGDRPEWRAMIADERWVSGFRDLGNGEIVIVTD